MRQMSPGTNNIRPLQVTFGVALVLVVTMIACSDTPTSPSSTTTTTTSTVAEPNVTEEFNGAVAVGGSSFYSFAVEQNGTVRVRLNRVTAANAPATVWMGLGLGTPSGEDCSATTSLNTQASEVAQITGTYAPGIYCAKVYDIGNLLMPASFYVTIDHP